MAFDFPAAPILDQIFTPVGGPSYKWNGTTWIVQVGATPVPSALIISDTAPPTPVEGDLWWESDRGILLVYYNDGLSTQWVQLSGPLVIPPQPIPLHLYSMKRTIFTASGTYTKPADLKCLMVEVLGGGGGGGSCAATGAAAYWSCGSGGGAGGYGSQFFQAAALPASVSYTVGGGGGSDGAGGTTTFSTASASGGSPGLNSGAATLVAIRGGYSGVTAGCSINSSTFSGGKCYGYWPCRFGGDGASNIFGQGGRGVNMDYNTGPVTAATGFGSGGGGPLNYEYQGARAGGAGRPGFIRITEYF